MAGRGLNVHRVHLFGLDFVTDASIDDLAELLVADGTNRDSATPWHTVVTPNVDHLIHYAGDPVERAVAEAAYLVLPDGMPIVWASRLLGARLQQRLAGSDLFAAWWQRVRASQRRVLVLAANEELATRLRAEHPLARCLVAPLFQADDDVAVQNLVDLILGEIEQHNPDAIVVGLSMAKAHVLARELCRCSVPAHGAPLLLLLGASAEFHVGLQKRAPRWVQRAGLEWVQRLLSNPRRLAKRYLVDDIAFVPMVWREWRARRAGCG